MDREIRKQQTIAAQTNKFIAFFEAKKIECNVVYIHIHNTGRGNGKIKSSVYNFEPYKRYRLIESQRISFESINK